MDTFKMIIDILVNFTGLFKDIGTFVAAFWNIGQIGVKFISWIVTLVVGLIPA